jgi:hypothetical protein
VGPKGLIGAAFLLVGGGFFVGGSYMLVDANRIALSGVATTGTIIGHEARGSRGGRAAVYTFRDNSGREMRGSVRIGLGGSSRSARQQREAEIGRKIGVFYDPADPRQSVADTVMGRWGGLLIMLFVVPHMLIGIYLLRRDRREQIEDGWVQRRF